MTKINSISDICEVIWRLEKKYKLLDLEIDDVKPWQYRRMAIYYMISEKTGVLEQAHAKLSSMDKLFSLFGLIKNSFFYNPFFLMSINRLIFPNERSKFVDGEYIDIYTNYLEKEFEKKDISFLTLERPFLGKHIRKPNKAKKYLDFIVLISNLFKKIINVNLTIKEQEICSNLRMDINKEFNIDIDIEKYFIESIQKYKINYYLYTKLLKKLNPKEIYIVISYAHGDVIKAAKDLNIKVKEIQHGTFSKYHLGYSFPDRSENLDYFPDSLLVWNNYWKDIVNLPIEENKIEIYPFQFLENKKLNYLNIKKNENQIVVLSQGAIGEKIANIIYDNINMFKNKKIIYKLHPGEYDRWENYPSLIKLSQIDSVEIVKDLDLYDIFASSKIQIGVFSTALYEGVEFNCETILLNLPGIEYMDKFIEYNNLKKTGNFYIGN
jgi:hypothetical protein